MKVTGVSRWVIEENGKVSFRSLEVGDIFYDWHEGERIIFRLIKPWIGMIDKGLEEGHIEIVRSEYADA
jgi:hypothetical protein